MKANKDFNNNLAKQVNRVIHKVSYTINELEELLNSNMDAIAFAAAKEILNKAGYNETVKVEQDIKASKVTLEITQ